MNRNEVLAEAEADASWDYTIRTTGGRPTPLFDPRWHMAEWAPQQMANEEWAIELSGALRPVDHFALVVDDLWTLESESDRFVQLGATVLRGPYHFPDECDGTGLTAAAPHQKWMIELEIPGKGVIVLAAPSCPQSALHAHLRNYGRLVPHHVAVPSEALRREIRMLGRSGFRASPVVSDGVVQQAFLTDSRPVILELIRRPPSVSTLSCSNVNQLSRLEGQLVGPQA